MDNTSSNPPFAVPVNNPAINPVLSNPTTPLPQTQSSTASPPTMNSNDALHILAQYLSQTFQGQNAQQASMQNQFQQLSTQLSSITANPKATTSTSQGPSPPQPSALFVPPSTTNSGAGTSMLSLFPDINEATLLAIVRHTFKPGHISKLDTRIKDKVPLTILDFENGALIHREQEPSTKEYPTWHSLYNPLVLYFSILQVHVSSSNNLPAIWQVIIGCNDYLCTLYGLYIEYDWTALLNYHFAFHARRLMEMAKGDYSRWSEIDGALQTRFLIGHPHICLPRDKSMSSWPPVRVMLLMKSQLLITQRQELIRDNVQLVQQISLVYNP